MVSDGLLTREPGRPEKGSIANRAGDPARATLGHLRPWMGRESVRNVRETPFVGVRGPDDEPRPWRWRSLRGRPSAPELWLRPSTTALRETAGWRAFWHGSRGL